MNQILISQKLYVTKEMKRKRIIYKSMYIVSLLVVLVLLAIYLYIDINKTQQEKIGQEIFLHMTQDNTTVAQQAIVIALDDNTESEREQGEEPVEQQIIPIQQIDDSESTQSGRSSVETSDGHTYDTEAILAYPRLRINYSVLTEENEDLLKVSVCKYWGPAPNKIGNYCIVGHNYRSGRMFGRLNEAEVGDEVKLTDVSGRTVVYNVYNIYVVEPTDVSCTSQLTNGKREMTLITCTDYGKRRLVVKCREV